MNWEYMIGHYSGNGYYLIRREKEKKFACESLHDGYFHKNHLWGPTCGTTGFWGDWKALIADFVSSGGKYGELGEWMSYHPQAKYKKVWSLAFAATSGEEAHNMKKDGEVEMTYDEFQPGDKVHVLQSPHKDSATKYAGKVVGYGVRTYGSYGPMSENSKMYLVDGGFSDHDCNGIHAVYYTYLRKA